MDILAGSINYKSLICAIISFLVALLVPIGVSIVLKLKTKGSIKSLIFGAVGFILSALVLEQILHCFVLVIKNPVSDYVKAHTWAYCLYGCLAAGVFEETGRFVMYKTFLKNKRDSSVPVLYGIGHGGFESIIIGAIQILSVIVLSLQVNSLGSAEALKNVKPEAVSSTLALVQPMFTGNPLILLAGGFERLTAMALHMALSILVYKAVTCSSKKWLYPFAILLHAIFDVPAVLYQRGVLGIWVCELFLFIAAAAILFYAVKFVYKSIE